MTEATGNRRTSMRATDKPFNIEKQPVYEAYKAVKSNGGAAGVDGQTIEQFEADLKSNLYKIWNRMSSGSYFPPPVRAVSIPKKSGGQRMLGVPTVADRGAQMVQEDGTTTERNRGTPQFGVISPVLANIFLHYTFDLWMTRTHPDLPWCRYADDGLVHCRNEQEAQALKAELQVRLAECRLEMHPTKTKIVYCKDGKRKGTYPNIQFDFLGYGFRPRLVRRSRDNTLFWGFNPAVSASALKAMRAAMRELNLRHRTDLPMDEIARQINPLLRGWIEYYGRYAPSALYPLLRYVNQMLLAWAMRKFRRFKAHKIRASRFLQKLSQEKAGLFVHWRLGMTGTFA